MSHAPLLIDFAVPSCEVTAGEHLSPNTNIVNDKYHCDTENKTGWELRVHCLSIQRKLYKYGIMSCELLWILITILFIRVTDTPTGGTAMRNGDSDIVQLS